MIFKRTAMTRDADEQFKDPLRVLERSDLSDEEKKSVLESWRLDLVELQVASSENMPDLTEPDSGDVAENLRRVTEALAALEDRH